uniref:Uncharacterized protein n=1 Tax=Romanomermis culicivorax TaxID=13658 RepID=A0A915KVL2_ROMCU
MVMAPNAYSTLLANRIRRTLEFALWSKKSIKQDQLIESPAAVDQEALERKKMYEWPSNWQIARKTRLENYAKMLVQPNSSSWG